MATPTSDSSRISPRQVLLVIGVIALLLVPTGAFMINEGVFDAIGPQEEVILQPYDGPNGEYATIDSNSELTINVTEVGANTDAVTEIERVFTITNTGDGTKQVWITHTNEETISFYADATGEPIGEDDNVTLSPDERVIVGLRVDTTGDTVRAGQSLVTTLLIHTRTFDEIDGPRLSVPGDVDFGNVSIGMTANTTLTISNPGATPLAIESIDLHGSDVNQFSVLATQPIGVLEPGEQRTLRIAYGPTTDGAHSASLAFTSNSSDEATKTVALDGRGVGPKIDVGKRELDFGNVTVGTSKTLTIPVKNRGSSPVDLHVRSAELVGRNPEAFNVTDGAPPFTLEPGERTEIGVTYSPETAGIKTAQLQIFSDATNSPQITVWMSNQGWRIRVQEIPRGSEGIDGSDEEFQLDTASVSEEATNVEMDVNGLPEAMDINVNVSIPATRVRGAGVDEVQFFTKRAGDFDMNFIHDEGPPTTDSRSYTPPTEREVVQYIRLWESIPSDSFENPSIKFRVKKSKLPGGVAPEDIVFRRFSDGEWNDHETTLVRESRAHYVFRVALPGLSQFVITAPDSEGVGQSEPEESEDPPRTMTPTKTPDDEPNPKPETRPVDETSVEGSTIQKGSTSISFLSDAVGNGSSPDLQDVVTVSNLSVPTPDTAGREGPKAAIQTGEGMVGGTESVAVNASGVSLQVAREDRVVQRIDAKGADALTLVRKPIPLTGSHSLFLSKEAIDDSLRMIRQVEITVPPEYENRSALIRMQIPRSKFGETAPENATIARLHGGWQLLDTTVVNTTPSYVVLAAQTPGFSRFAVYADNGVSYAWEVETYEETLPGSQIQPQFDSTGVFNVSLTVTDAFGLTDSADYRIISNDIPEVSFEARGPVVPNESVLLEATVADDLGNVSLNWTLPNGSTASGQRVQYTFEEGLSKVEVVATDEFGATASAEKTFRPGSGPSLDIELLSVTIPFEWPIVLLTLLVIPLVVVLRRGLPMPDHPPTVETLAEPCFDLHNQSVILPRLRVVDRGEDLERIAVTIIHYDGRTIAAESARLDDGWEYDGTAVCLSVNPDEGLERGATYAVEVRVTDAAGEETIEARSARVNRFIYPFSESFSDGDATESLW